MYCSFHVDLLHSNEDSSQMGDVPSGLQQFKTTQFVSRSSIKASLAFSVTERSASIVGKQKESRLVYMMSDAVSAEPSSHPR